MFGSVTDHVYVLDLSVDTKGGPGDAHVDVLGDGSRVKLISLGVDLSRPDLRDVSGVNCTEPVSPT